MGDTTITGNGNVIGDHNSVTVIYQGAQVVIPSLEAVTAHRQALRQALEDRARARWGEMSAYIQEEGATLPLEASPYDQGCLGARENLLSTLRTVDRLLVLGEPGSGKTVALERLAWELCKGREPLIPVLIPLFNYAGTELAGWVRAKLKEQGCLRLDNADALEAFLETPPTRCFFLFDGLNEVAPPYRDTLVDQLTRWMEGHPRHAVICTSRSQDEIWGRLRGEVRTVVVQALDQMGEAMKPFVEPALRGTDHRQWKVALRYLIKHPDNPSEHVMELSFRMAADGDEEIADLAVQVLLQMGDAVRDRALRLAQEPKDSLHRGGLNYLGQLLGFSVVYVPPGPFWLGSDKAEDSLADDDEAVDFLPDGEEDPRARDDRARHLAARRRALAASRYQVDDEAEDSLTFDDEAPKHQVTLPGYWIAKTPVTVAQFRAFVEAEGYKAHEEALKGPDDHPVVYVSWDDALAYCRWLSKRTGLTVTLPSEAEWEKAARGADGRLYPWGNAKPDARLCNFDNYEKGTTPVGRYSPRGDSPYGCMDMAGNVWEWTRSLYKAYPYDPKDWRENLGSRARRVVRGGAFCYSGGFARCARRVRGRPGNRADDIGFRLVLSSYL